MSLRPCLCPCRTWISLPKASERIRTCNFSMDMDMYWQRKINIGHLHCSIQIRSIQQIPSWSSWMSRCALFRRFEISSGAMPCPVTTAKPVCSNASESLHKTSGLNFRMCFFSLRSLTKCEGVSVCLTRNLQEFRESSLLTLPVEGSHVFTDVFFGRILDNPSRVLRAMKLCLSFVPLCKAEMSRTGMDCNTGLESNL